MFLYIEANYINGSFPEGVGLYRFNHTQLSKTEEILKITKLMGSINFQIMIQAVIKSFRRSTDEN